MTQWIFYDMGPSIVPSSHIRKFHRYCYSLYEHQCWCDDCIIHYRSENITCLQMISITLSIQAGYLLYLYTEPGCDGKSQSGYFINFIHRTWMRREEDSCSYWCSLLGYRDYWICNPWHIEYDPWCIFAPCEKLTSLPTTGVVRAMLIEVDGS